MTERTEGGHVAPWLWRFPAVIPAKCFARGCENTASENGQRIFCDVHHALLGESDPEREARAREVVRENERLITLELHRAKWRRFWRGLLIAGLALLLAEAITSLYR